MSPRIPGTEAEFASACQRCSVLIASSAIFCKMPEHENMEKRKLTSAVVMSKSFKEEREKR